MRVHLKIKIKSLAAEARIIRLEELRRKGGDVRTSLHHHRVGVVRREARLALLAYGFLRGREYTTIEPAPLSQPDWTRLGNMIDRFAEEKDKGYAERFKLWREAGEGACKAALTRQRAGQQARLDMLKEAKRAEGLQAAE